MTTSVPCLFCRMVKGEIPAELAASNVDAIIIRDINPQAPVHLLVIPRRHSSTATELAGEDPELFGRLMATAAETAVRERLDNGYRLVINTGMDGGQTVDHLHIHVLGGRAMSWPPG